MQVGVLTGGGDCPGLNAVIRAVVRKGDGVYGYNFVGFRDGWKGPLEGLTMPLGVPEVRGILPRGGTILGSSRTNPFKVEGGVEQVRANLARLQIDEKGNVTDVNITVSDPPRVFDKVVRAALENWKFKAEGERYVGEVEINFTLKDE